MTDFLELQMLSSLLSDLLHHLPVRLAFGFKSTQPTA